MASRPRATNPQTSTGNMIADSALGLVPETLSEYMALNRKIWESGPLPPAQIEIARLRNARKVNCVFCKSVRYDIAWPGLSPEEKAEGCVLPCVAYPESDVVLQGSAI